MSAPQQAASPLHDALDEFLVGNTECKPWLRVPFNVFHKLFVKYLSLYSSHVGGISGGELETMLTERGYDVVYGKYGSQSGFIEGLSIYRRPFVAPGEGQ